MKKLEDSLVGKMSSMLSQVQEVLAGQIGHQASAPRGEDQASQPSSREASPSRAVSPGRAPLQRSASPAHAAGEDSEEEDHYPLVDPGAPGQGACPSPPGPRPPIVISGDQDSAPQILPYPDWPDMSAPAPATSPGSQGPPLLFPVNLGSEDFMDVADSVQDSQDQEAPPQGMARVEGLEDFALPGLAPAFSVSRPPAGPSELQERMWVSARGGELLRRVPVDRLEQTYQVTSGPFQAPPAPKPLLSLGNVKEADDSLRVVQQHWGTMGIAITKAVTQIEEVVRSLQSHASSQDPIPHQELARLTQDLSGEAVRPLSHILRFSASKFNQLQARRKDKIQAAVIRADPILGSAVRDTPLSNRTFFSEDLSSQIKESQARKSQKDLIKAVASSASGARPRQGPYDRPQHHVPSFRRADSGPNTSSRGRGRGGRQPFRGGRASQAPRGRQATSAAGGPHKGRGYQKDNRE